MIVDPVLIIGAPRSGTSLLQKILRGSSGFWSLPSESNEIWDKYCHPQLRDWDSEYMTAEDLEPQTRAQILQDFDEQIWNAILWRLVGSNQLIWSPTRSRKKRILTRKLFYALVAASRPIRSKSKRRRLLEKTASNCFRLGYVDAIFPDAKYIHITRDGRSTVNSLINGWRHPSRFFTYEVPVGLKIGGYDFSMWNFVLPPDWREYVKRPLEEVCAFQWIASNEHVLREFEALKYSARIMRLTLEGLTEHPERELKRIAEFIQVPYERYFRKMAADIPVVNSLDNTVDHRKWSRQNKQMVEAIIPTIAPMMQRLGYGV